MSEVKLVVEAFPLPNRSGNLSILHVNGMPNEVNCNNLPSQCCIPAPINPQR